MNDSARLPPGAGAASSDGNNGLDKIITSFSQNPYEIRDLRDYLASSAKSGPSCHAFFLNYGAILRIREKVQGAGMVHGVYLDGNHPKNTIMQMKKILSSGLVLALAMASL
ncbi:MAG: hypothetical protein EOP50_13315, partial [Sphingobacteriales bacterium]